MFKKGDLVKCILTDEGMHVRNPPIGTVGVVTVGQKYSDQTIEVAWFADRPEYYKVMLREELAHVEAGDC